MAVNGRYALLIALALCGCKKAARGAVEPVRVEAARGAVEIELSPDGGRLAVQRCAGEAPCTVEVLRMGDPPGGATSEGAPVEGALLGWIGERVMMVRRSGDELVVFDDRGGSRALPVAPDTALRGAACGGDWCALSLGGAQVDVVAVHGADGAVEVVAHELGGAEPLYGGDKAHVAVAVDRTRPVAYVAVDAPGALVAVGLDDGKERWRTQLLDHEPYGSTTPLLALSNDGRSLLVVQADHAYDVFEPVVLEVLDAGTGARTGSTRAGPGQITDLAPSGPGGVVVLAVREPHAHSGGYSHWVGTVVFELGAMKLDATTLNAAEWHAPNPRETGPYPRAVAVTSAGVVLVAMER